MSVFTAVWLEAPAQPSDLQVFGAQQPIMNRHAGVALCGKSWREVHVAQQDEVLMVADVRIDDRDHLCRTLGKERGISDPDLIFSAWRQWGTDFPTHISGDFAIVILDLNRDLVFAVRDALGVRPLFYFNDPRGFYFSTSAKALARHSAIDGQLDQDALLMHAHGLYKEIPLYRGLHALPPGEVITIKSGQLTRSCWWDLANLKTLHYKQAQEYSDHLRSLLQTCVSDRVNSNVGIASALSGGMDSSSVTALAAKDLKDKTGLVPVSFRFRSLVDCDESQYSQALCEQMGLDPFWIDCESFHFLQDAFPASEAGEDPFYCWDPMERDMFKKLVARGVDVFLTGHGGDHMLTGVGDMVIFAEAVRRGNLRAFGHFFKAVKAKKRNLLRAAVVYLLAPSLPSRIRRGLRHRLGQAVVKPLPWITAPQMGSLLNRWDDSRRVFAQSDRQRAYETMFAGIGTVRRVIHWYERVGREYGVAVRHPLFDRRIAEFMLAIPSDKARIGRMSKGLLRMATKDLIPDNQRQTKIKPDFFSYYHRGVLKELDQIKAQIDESPLAKLGLISPENLRTAIDEYIATAPGKASASFWHTLMVDRFLLGFENRKEKGLRN